MFRRLGRSFSRGYIVVRIFFVFVVFFIVFLFSFTRVFRIFEGIMRLVRSRLFFIFFRL